MEITKISTVYHPVLRKSEVNSQKRSTAPVKTTQNNNDNKSNNQKIALASGALVLLTLLVFSKKIKKWFTREKPVNINKPNDTPKPKETNKPKEPENIEKPKTTPEPKPAAEPKPEPAPKIIADEQFIADLKLRIKNAKNYYELKSTELETGQIQQDEIRNEILTNIEAARQKMIQKKLKEHFLSRYEVAEMMEESYQKPYTVPEEKVNLIKSRLGEKASKAYCDVMKKPITDYKTIEIMTSIANKCDGKYLDFWKANPDMLKFYTTSHDNDLAYEQVHMFNNKMWDILISNFIKSIDGTMNEDMLDSIIKYSKSSYYDNINGILRLNHALNEPATQENLDYLKELIRSRQIFGIVPENMEHCQKEILSKIDTINNKMKLSEDIDNDIQELKNYINDTTEKLGLNQTIENIKKSSSILEQDIKVTRLEHFSFLEGIKCNDMDIYEAMLEGRTNPEVASQVEKYFSDGGEISVIRPAFLSTSIPPYHTCYGAKLNIKLKKGTEYVYTSDLQHCFDGKRVNTEAEILVMPGHKMTVTNAIYEKYGECVGRWVLDCTVEKA